MDPGPDEERTPQDDRPATPEEERRSEDAHPEQALPADEHPLSEDERAELERLRALVAARPRRDRSGVLRWVATGILLVLTAVLMIGAVVARTSRSIVLDTDRYVAIVTPLGSDPAVQSAIADKITQAIVANVDIKARTADAMRALTDNVSAVSDRPRVSAALNSLPSLVATQAESFIHTTAVEVVSSSQFQQLWVAANRRAHDALVAVATGETRPGIQVDSSGTVSISLQDVLTVVRQRLDDRGFTFLDGLPSFDKQFVLFQSDALVRMQKAVRVIDRLGTALPWLALATAAGAVWVAPAGRRLRALSLVGLTTVAAMLVLALLLLFGRQYILGAIPQDTLPAPAATTIVGAVIEPVRTSLRTLAALGVIVAATGYLTGSSTSARRARAGIRQAVEFVRRPRSARPPTGVEVFAAHYLKLLRLLVLAVAVLILVNLNYPSWTTVAWLTLGTVLILLLLEVVARPGVPQDTAIR
ncbi:putative nucleic acid-binding Zn ribbon protein [Nocardia transvalensis]|uniref:Putative nucleic acid-binding Zn ribbon protein n=1 Tax=Nocardia transvalensis TaxID=37333 RepID=A0A7W9UG91_9NOCA|nr:hypothetical protein [Nocardia transvalensis]MBB5912019.1 putative nucleic acid-binding Zn ribbon protein [Nocardia transvalensis]